MASRSPIYSGFGYVGVLILVAIIAVAATATIQLGAVARRRDAERELLYIGGQFQLALRSYRDSSAVDSASLPTELDQLLRDPRLPSVRRHIRAIPVDPMTGAANWGIVRSPAGGIIGVHSLSDARSIKVGNFEPEFASFEGKVKVSEWVFSVSPGPSPSLPPPEIEGSRYPIHGPPLHQSERNAYRLAAGARSSRHHDFHFD